MAQSEHSECERQCDEYLARAFEILGKRWNGLVLGTLKQGPGGFAELRRALGPITDSVLSDRLSELTAAGLITREVTDTRPPGVIYALSRTGEALIPVLDDLARWARANMGAHANA